MVKAAIAISSNVFLVMLLDIPYSERFAPAAFQIALYVCSVAANVKLVFVDL
jgi:hypothetical protein